MVAERDGIRVYSCGCEVRVPKERWVWTEFPLGQKEWMKWTRLPSGEWMPGDDLMPTSLQDPERARQQRAQYPPPDEADWMGLLLGIGAAVTAIGLCVGATYALLGYL